MMTKIMMMAMMTKMTRMSEMAKMTQMTMMIMTAKMTMMTMMTKTATRHRADTAHPSHQQISVLWQVKHLEYCNVLAEGQDFSFDDDLILM